MSKISKNKETWHHIIPTSRGGLNGTNNKNTILLNQTKIHAPLHAAFGNAFPQEQLIEILNNPKNKIKNNKKEDLYKILGISSYHEIYLPEVIINLEDFYWNDGRVGQITNQNKIAKYQNILFRKEKTTEDKLLKMYNIAKTTLKEEFKTKLLNIIN